MRSVMLRGTELQFGMGVGDRPQGLRAYFQSNLTKGQKSSRHQVALEMPYMATKFGPQNPWPKHNALLGSKVMQGSAEVNQRSNILEKPYGYKIWSKESLTKA